MDNKKTPSDDLQARKAEAWEAIERTNRQAAEKQEVSELATLHGAALRLNIDEFLKRRDEFIGTLYRAADYSLWKLRDTYTQYQWAALTLGLEPNEDDPPMGPVPFRRGVSEGLERRYTHSQQNKPYFHRLDSFDFRVGHEFFVLLVIDRTGFSRLFNCPIVRRAGEGRIIEMVFPTGAFRHGTNISIDRNGLAYSRRDEQP